MKIEVSKKDLLGAIKKVNSIGEAKGLSALQSIFLQVDSNTGNLGLVHTTLDLTAYSEIEAVVDNPELVLVEDKLFSQIIANQPETVKMELQDKILKIGKYKINILNVNDFPKIDVPTEVLEKIELDRDVSAFKNFVSKDDTRYELKHIYFNKGMVSATDAKVFVAYNMSDFKSEILVKPEILNKEVKSIEVYKDFILVKSDNLVVRQQKVEGEFPDVEKYIPVYNNVVEFDLNELKDLVAKTIPLVTEYNLAVRLTITKDKIEVSKQSERGEFKDEIPAKSPIDIKIAFNPYYLLNFLKFIPEGRVKTGVDGEHTILYEDGKSIAMLMPMKWD